jgi:DNA (cytosine-5)-methyltransferase 1
MLMDILYSLTAPAELANTQQIGCHSVQEALNMDCTMVASCQQGAATSQRLPDADSHRKMDGTTVLADEADDKAAAVVDLFCGAGGLAYGLKMAGLHVAAGVDLDPNCRHPLEANTGAIFACRDVSDLVPSDLVNWFGDASVRVLAGCAPCQPFSTYSQSRKSEDRRWTLLREFQRLATALRPEIVTMENVLGLATQPVWEEFIAALREAEYHVSWREVLCTDYGIPQSRRRLVLLASLFGPIELINTMEKKGGTVREAIGALPPIAAGEASPGDPLHVSSSLSPLNLKRIRVSKPGGTWRDWPESLRANCHIQDSGKTYPAVYGRMEWEKPAPTMTTQCYGFGNGRFGHPEQDRAISLREAALLQSFPRDYSFLQDGAEVSFKRLGTLIGNAVPPKLGEAIGISIRAHLQQVRSGAYALQEQLSLF